MSDSFTLDFEGDVANIHLTRYRSKRTGLTAVVGQAGGPTVNGFFSVATEAPNDAGLPHTLEHLVFLGSETYPYKGVLDQLATRCLSTGTNAWTEIDNTTYTLSTAGSEGFLALLPIYLDHILYPTITDEGFITEVHHVNGEGKDGGVVFSEMQSRENGPDDRVAVAAQRMLFPETSGFRYQVGGIMEDIRTLTVDKIREYHKRYYRPDNLCVLVVGSVKAEELLKTLERFETERILTKPKPGPLVRPFHDKIEPLKESIESTVEFAAEDESAGVVRIGWLGADYKSFDESVSTEVACQYLAGGDSSPLSRVFVECEDPLCSDVVSNSASRIYSLGFNNIPPKRMDEVWPRFNEALGAHLQDGIDKTRMRDTIVAYALQVRGMLESDPGKTISIPVINDFVHGEGAELFKQRLRLFEKLESLQSRPESYWTQVLQQVFLDAPHALIKAVPSAKYAAKVSSEEEERVAKRLKQGKKWIEEQEEAVKAAVAHNERPIPPTMLSAVSVPSVDNIKYFDVRVARMMPEGTPDAEREENSGDAKLLGYLCSDNTATTPPIALQFSDMPSQFVTLSALIDTSSLSDEHRSLLPLLCSVLFKAPLDCDGRRYTREDVAEHLLLRSVASQATVGFDGEFSRVGDFAQVVVLKLKMLAEHYEECVSWLYAVMYNASFPSELLPFGLAFLNGSLNEALRDGLTVDRAAMNSLLFDGDHSNLVASGLETQAHLIPHLIKEAEEDYCIGLEKRLTELYRELTSKPSAIRIAVAGPITKIPQPLTAFNRFPRVPKGESIEHPAFASSLLIARPPAKCLAVLMSSLETSHVMAAGKGVRSYNADEYAHLLVAAEALTMIEGPMWQSVRGRGLAYAFAMGVSPEQDTLSFMLTRCADVGHALMAAAEVVRQCSSEPDWPNATSLDGAKASVIFTAISAEENLDVTATTTARQWLRRLSREFTPELVDRINAVTADQVRKATKEYIIPLFDANSAYAYSLAIPAAQKAEVCTAFETAVGRPLVSITLAKALED